MKFKQYLNEGMIRGYDGVAFQEEHFGAKGITYVPFYENQIKVLEVPV